MRLTTAIVAFVALCSCDGTPAEPAGAATRCPQVRDRLVELSLADTGGADHGAHRRTMLQAAGAELVRACERAMTAAQRECVLGAIELASVRACVTRGDDRRPAAGDQG